MTTIMDAERFDPASFARGTKARIVLTYEESEEKSAEIPVHLIKGNADGPLLLILAAVHGDEYEGVQTAIELGRMVEPEDLQGTLLLVPIANAYAYRAADRFAPEDGRNLAREFPGQRDGTPTQRLAWHLGNSLIRKADFLLDLHSGGTYYEIPALVGYEDNDGEARGRRSKAAAEAFGMETVWGHARLAPGRSISYAAELNIPWLYTEAAGGRRVKRQEQRKFREGALRLMAFLGLLAGSRLAVSSPVAPTRHRLGGNGDFDASVTAEEEGFFIPEAELLQEVREGQRIGAVYDVFGDVKRAYAAICDGIVVGIAGTPAVKPGSVLYLIAQKQQD